MEIKDRIAAEFDKRKEGLLIFALLLGFGFFINRGVELKGLYMDDLYLWSCYGEQSFSEFVFPVGSTRFRFIFYLASWLELLLLGNHVTWMVPFNVILNAGIGFTVYKMSVSMSRGRKLISLALGIAYLLSRLSYYQIGQFYGLMESLGLWAAMGILYFLYRYVNERDTRSYLLANLLYFTASFIHERYMALIPALLLALLMGKDNGIRVRERKKSGISEEEVWIDPEKREKSHARDSYGRSRNRGTARNGARGRSEGGSLKNRRRREQAGASKWLLLLVSAAVFLLIQGIRLAAIGTLSPAGTGGTDVEDTFQMADAIAHGWEQVAFVFGRNSGPEYLCTMAYENSPWNIQMLILASNVVLAVLVLVFLVQLFRDRGQIVNHLKNAALFLAFIALCIGASSVTIRVEMRWVYVVYAAALVFLAYMSGILGKAGILIFLYVALLFPSETFYREHWDQLYYMPNQLRYNSLAEETVGTYGDEIFDKQVYIIGNSYELSDFTAETFLKVYAGGDEEKNTVLQFIDSDFDLKEITDDMVILSEDPDHNAYHDVTEFLRKQRMNLAYGSYEDGWMDEEARIVFLNGDTEKLTLNCYYPGTITGEQVCRIRMNGKQMPDLIFTDNMMTYEIETAPYQTVSLEFSCNFHVNNAQEKRGERELAMIVTMGEKNKQ